MEIIKKNFGEQLKFYRKLKNLTQEKLAEKIGINLRQLARIESGESFVSTETLYNICNILEISPKLLFDFNISEEYFMTGTDGKVHFKVIKNGNVIQLVNDCMTKSENNSNGQNDFDKHMLKIAKNLNKEIIVDESHSDSIFQTKMYYPNGEIKIVDKNSENEKYNELLEKISSIKNDSKKLEYLSLAYDSLTSKYALEELKSMIKGIELTQN